MYDLKAVLLRAYIENSTINPPVNDVIDDFTMRQYIHYVGHIDKSVVMLAAYFNRCENRVYKGFATMRIMSDSEMWTIPVTQISTDLRSGPSIIDNYIPNAEYWWIWLIHDLMGSCGKGEEDRTRQILKNMMSHHDVPLANLIDKVTFYTRWLWTTSEISPVVTTLVDR